MAITNQDKPPASVDAKLNIGSSFNLLVDSLYGLIIGAAGGDGFSNVSKVSIGETWGGIETTWAAETDTWLAASQIIGNTSKPTTSITNTVKPS